MLRPVTDIEDTKGSARGATSTPESKALRMLRAFVDMTQEELAERSGVNNVLISNYETSTKTPRDRNVNRLLAGMGLPRSAWDETLETVDSLDDERARLGGTAEGEALPEGEEESTMDRERRRIERTASRVARLVKRAVRVLLEFQLHRRRA